MSIAGGKSFGECKKVYESHDDSRKKQLVKLLRDKIIQRIYQHFFLWIEGGGLSLKFSVESIGLSKN